MLTQFSETGQWATSNGKHHTGNLPLAFRALRKTCKNQDDLLGSYTQISQDIRDHVPAHPSDKLQR